jgi:hypothetical protein
MLGSVPAVQPADPVLRGDRLVMADDLANDEGEKFLGEIRDRDRLRRPDRRSRFDLLPRGSDRTAAARASPSARRRPSSAEPLGQRMDQDRVEIVDRAAKVLEDRLGLFSVFTVSIAPSLLLRQAGQAGPPPSPGRASVRPPSPGSFGAHPVRQARGLGLLLQRLELLPPPFLPPWTSSCRPSGGASSEAC